ncbi:gamma-glutamyl-gamma-aminobutyrate hydrolase family protein [Sciscionella marina]|uniref:gamma-glutamyl-gamma-aminobutyrate hydrolase family protein n=1 Tax=Sciscionella marina TaxID=508770 RepID=UPI00036A3F16|nr:gamma-glutamyl-gamma-aminobutyrate hydrolase family protein [Sciscionella marina]
MCSQAPVIGLTAYAQRARFGVWDTESVVLHRNYVDAVSRAGGVAVLLPPVPGAADAVLRAVDGIVLSGGPDVEPARYGAARAAETGPPAEDRDGFELELARAALDRGLPILGVCRGLQILNTGLGGTLEQHIDEPRAPTHQPAPGEFGAHEVTVTEGSRLSEVLGGRAGACCHHHQAVGRLAEGLRAVAHAGDGTIEGVELPGESFVLAVQWHPEAARGDDRLFEALVRECV